MKRLLCALLALLILCGCSAAPAASAPAATTLPAATEAPASTAAPTAAPESTSADTLTGPEALEAGTILLYRQEDLEARQGSLQSLEALLSAPEDALLPRTHYYDARFPGEQALWLKLLDYALANGWIGFSVPAGTLPELDTKQRSALKFMYRLDYGKVLSLERDGVLTVWYDCEKPDAMEKLSLGLAEARQIAAEAPRGDDWETVSWLFNWLAEQVAYGDRDPYYFRRGHLLYDALVERDCLCSGYADALYYLCSLCGVDSLVMCGISNNPDRPGGTDDHAWNLVRIYGDWYCCDPTSNAVSRASGAVETNVSLGLSSAAAEMLLGNKPGWDFTEEGMFPDCPRCFRPEELWNTTPEGALRSWLWFSPHGMADPSFLLVFLGLLGPETAVTPSADGTGGVLDIPWADYAAAADRFMREDAARFFPTRFFEAEDGRLAFRMSESALDIDWAALELGAVREENGVWTAELGAVDAQFTVSLREDGLYRIETLDLIPHE